MPLGQRVAHLGPLRRPRSLADLRWVQIGHAELAGAATRAGDLLARGIEDLASIRADARSISAGAPACSR